MTELAIQAHDLGKTFGQVKAVRSLDLEVPRSRIYGFLGPNGSGKTTAIRMLCGLLTPTTGDINVLGHSIPDEAEALRLKVGYMTQKVSLFEDLTVVENLEFMADIYTLERKLKRQRIGLATERYELSRFLKQRAGTLSGGQKQRLALAASTLHDPELLFLDEPTAGLDPIGAAAFDQLLLELQKNLQLTVFMVTHDLDTIYTVCNRVAVLGEKTLLVSGSLDEVASYEHPWVQEYFHGARSRSTSQ